MRANLLQGEVSCSHGQLDWLNAARVFLLAVLSSSVDRSFRGTLVYL